MWEPNTNLKVKKKEKKYKNNKEGAVNWSNEFNTSLFNKSDMVIKDALNYESNEFVRQTHSPSEHWTNSLAAIQSASTSHRISYVKQIRREIKHGIEHDSADVATLKRPHSGDQCVENTPLDTNLSNRTIHNTSHRKQKRSERQIFIERTDKRAKLKAQKRGDQWCRVDPELPPNSVLRCTISTSSDRNDSRSKKIRKKRRKRGKI